MAVVVVVRVMRVPGDRARSDVDLFDVCAAVVLLWGREETHIDIDL